MDPALCIKHANLPCIAFEGDVNGAFLISHVLVFLSCGQDNVGTSRNELLQGGSDSMLKTQDVLTLLLGHD